MDFEEWRKNYVEEINSCYEYSTLHEIIWESAFTAGLQSSTPYTEGYAKGYSDGVEAKREAEKACRNRAAEYWDHEAGALEVAAAIRKLEV